jgi:hypothetical protein
MKISCCRFDWKQKPPKLEVTESEINGAYQRELDKYSYPRHISSYNSESHRQYGKILRNIPSLPKSCQLPVSQVEQSEVLDTALNILRYQLNNEQAQQTHLDNLRHNLERRLQAAKASGNDFLIDLLQAESQQLEMNV